VAEALAVAGGLTPTAKTQVFLFHRVSSQWAAVSKVDIRDILKGQHLNDDLLIKPGDMVFVPEKFIVHFRKYVPYNLMVGSYLQGTGF
jgi:polysaccharide export outer membrane protein